MYISTTRKKVGSIGVDSGQVLIIDPCYVLDDEFNPNSEPTGGKYDAVCRTTLSDDGYGEVLYGVASATYGGDGHYPVYAEVDKNNGRVVRLIIEFVEDENDEDYCSDCGYSDCDNDCVDEDDE